LGLAVHPHRGLVGADNPGPPQPGEDGLDLVIEAWLGPAKGGVQGAFADLQGEQLQEQPVRRR
jgi:hypothetical protein